MHHVPSLIYFSQAISRPRQIVQDRGIVFAPSGGFLKKTVGPGEIATLVGDLSENTGDLGIGWRQLARFVCVSESFLLVPKRSSIELRKLGYGGGQFRIQFQRLLKSRGRLVRCALFFVSFSQTHLGDDIVRLLFGHCLEL